jgi:hypothetical protein
MLSGVRFVVTRVPGSPEKLRGIDYSLTLHGSDGERLVGFDNAHPAARQKRGEPQDHRHGWGRSGLTPKVMHDRVELDLPLTLPRKTGEP